jgi:DNA-directed RNA polymerase subunit M/transcription elongation factor TFIIS
MAQKNISIIELDRIETKAILKDTKFSSLKPVVCTKCGNEIDFERRLFQIRGVAKSKRSDDEIQNVIEYHFKQNYSIDHIFFKSLGPKFLVDTAICSNCQSTAITYDIDLDLISMIEKTTENLEL